MEIVVQGTKHGRHTFTPNKIEGLLDVTPDQSKASAIGKMAYAIRFVENNIIFSKYKIIRDVRGEKRTGFIAFSLFLASNEKLSGKNIISLLDEVSSEYFQRYIPDNDNNLNDVREKWDFVKRIYDKYSREISTVSIDAVENLLSGPKDDAFIYYKGEEELEKYFNVPYQEKYCAFRQVLFIEEGLQHKDENPLNALRHSDVNLSDQIDLENPEYRLFFNQNTKDGVKIDIEVNNSTRYNKSKIRKKEILKIRWSKPNHITVIKNGKCHELNPKYVSIDDNARSVSIKEIELIPIEKSITLDIQYRNEQYRNENPIRDAKISCESGTESKTVNDNKITFKGEDLGKRWAISATKGDNWFLNHLIDFIRDCPGDNETVRLQLNERKKVSFSGRLGDMLIDNINLKIEQKTGYEGTSEVEFLNEEIERTFNATATCKFDNSNYFGEKLFSPKDNDTVLIDLSKEKISKYMVDEGEHGKENEDCPDYSRDKEGNDVKGFIKPQRGWKFTGFKLDESEVSSDFEGILVAQYEKKYNLAIKVVALIFSVLIISVGTWLFWPKENIQNVLLTEHKIKNYVEGVELNNDTLNSYKAIGEIQNGLTENEEKSKWYNPLTWLNSDNQTSELNEVVNWKKASGWIDVAIKKRNSIDNWDFMILKDSTRYFDEQQIFKKAIMKIDSTQYDAIQKRFNDVSYWNLNQIADSINHYLTPRDSLSIDSSENKEALLVNEEDKTKAQEAKKPSDKVKNNNQSKEETRIEKSRGNESKSTSKSNDVKQKLKSGTITINQLEEYKNENNADVKKSVELYLEFWKLVKNNSNQKNDFDNLLKKVNKDNTLKGSELKKLLNSICANPDAFQKYSNAPGKAAVKTVNELKTKIQ